MELALFVVLLFALALLRRNTKPKETQAKPEMSNGDLNIVVAGPMVDGKQLYYVVPATTSTGLPPVRGDVTVDGYFE